MTSVLGAEALRLIRLFARLSFYFSSTAARANWFPRMEFWFWIRLNAAGSAYLAVFPRFISEWVGERDRNQESYFDVLPDLQKRKTRDLCVRLRKGFQSSHLFGSKLLGGIPPLRDIGFCEPSFFLLFLAQVVLAKQPTPTLPDQAIL